MWLDKEKGQTLLIVVLVMVVSLTVGLAVVSRSITSLRISSEEASSQAAFSAAEAGVEQALKTGEGITASQELGNNAQIKQVTVTQIQGTEFLVNNGNPVSKDDGADVWLVSHNVDGTPNYSSHWDGNLTLYWGDSSGDCNNAALEVVVISGTVLSPVSTRYTADPCGPPDSRRLNNNFSSPSSGGGTIGGKIFPYKMNINSISSGLIARIIPLYYSTPVGVSGTNALPAQGSIITSTGESGSTQRKITLFRGYSRVPLEFFQYVLFSPR